MQHVYVGTHALASGPVGLQVHLISTLKHLNTIPLPAMGSVLA